MRNLINMADAWNEIRKEVTCSICLDLLKEPKILPCLHTFCKICLQDLWEKSDVQNDRATQHTRNIHTGNIHTETIDDSSKDSVNCLDTVAQVEVLQKSEKHLRNVSLYKQLNNREIKCSICPEKVSITSVDALPSNEPAQQLVELVRMEQQISGETPPSCQSCDNELGAIALCLQCDAFLCTACVAVHKKLKLLSSHQVVSFDDVKTGKINLRRILDQKREHCSVHPDKLLELFCKEEGCFICLGCAVVKHRDHEYEEVFAVAEQYRAEIDCTLSDVRAGLKKLEKAVDEVRDRQSQIQLRKLENTLRVEKTFEEIMLALNKRKKQITDNINETAAGRIKALDKQCEELTNKCAQMKSYLELVEVKLQSETDRAIVSMKGRVVGRGDELVKAVWQTELLPVETVPNKVEFCRLQKVLGLINLFSKPDVCTKKCKLTRSPTRNNFNVYQVMLKDSHSRAILGYSDVITVQVFPNENMPLELGKVPKINDEGNGRYTFYISKGESCVNSRRGYQCRCEKFGSVYVQVGGEDMPGSPMR